MKEQKDFTTVENLECILSQDEMLKYADILANKNQEKARLEAEKKTIVSEFQAKINSAIAEIDRYSLALATKHETREVDCEIRYNSPDIGLKTIIRLDTGKEVRKVPMTNYEKSDMFINKTGDQDGIFIFNDFQEAPIVDKKVCCPEDAGIWQTIGQPKRAEDLVSEEINEDRKYRVVKGEDETTGAIGYLLQINVAGKGPETVEKPKAGKKRGPKPKNAPKAKETPEKPEEGSVLESAMQDITAQDPVPVIDDQQKPPAEDPDPTCSNCEGGDLCEGCESQSHWQPKAKADPKKETPAPGKPEEDDSKLLDQIFIDNGITTGEAETYLQKEGALGFNQQLNNAPFAVEWIRQNLKEFIKAVKWDLAGRSGDENAPKLEIDF